MPFASIRLLKYKSLISSKFLSAIVVPFRPGSTALFTTCTFEGLRKSAKLLLIHSDSTMPAHALDNKYLKSRAFHPCRLLYSSRKWFPYICSTNGLCNNVARRMKGEYL